MFKPAEANLSDFKLFVIFETTDISHFIYKYQLPFCLITSVFINFSCLQPPPDEAEDSDDEGEDISRVKGMTYVDLRGGHE